MSIWHHLLLSLFLLVTPTHRVAAQAPEPDPIYLVGVPGGVTIVWNLADLHMTADVEGEIIKPLRAEGLCFVVDGQILQFLLVPFTDFVPTGFAGASDADLLQMHRKYEARHIATNVFGQDLSITGDVVQLGPDRVCLVWSYATPSDSEAARASIVRQMYASVRVEERIFMVSGPLLEGQSRGDLENRLVDILASADTQEAPIEVEDVQGRAVDFEGN